MMLFLIRGLPGSGKTTYAKQMVEDYGLEHYEADMFFTNENGVYHFSPETLKDAHAWCQKAVFDALMCGKNVVVSNVFSQQWEAQPYYDMCKKLGCMFQIIERKENYGSIHNVPQQTIDKMRARWEDHSEWFKETVK
jgi:predicted kinase